MPTNVSPEYKAAETRYRAAKTDEERLEALEEMGSTLNKHKGTEKLYADIKRRIKALREGGEKQVGKRTHAIKVEREGAGQVVLVGEPNAGKSALLAAVTNATPEVADYPYTTRAPIPGMLIHGDVGIQLVDLPPVSAQYTESWVYNIVRTADAVLLVVSLVGADPTTAIEEPKKELLEHAKVPLLGRGEKAPDDPRLAAKPVVLVATHLDVPGAEETLGIVRELYPSLPIAGVGKGTDPKPVLAPVVYDMLGVVRVYSKAPGKEPDRSKPYVFKRGSTLLDFAARVHRDIAERLSYARVWGLGKYDGQRVQRDYVLSEGDVVELHA
jgi:uncharacterized protein